MLPREGKTKDCCSGFIKERPKILEKVKEPQMKKLEGSTDQLKPTNKKNETFKRNENQNKKKTTETFVVEETEAETEEEEDIFVVGTGGTKFEALIYFEN